MGIKYDTITMRYLIVFLSFVFFHLNAQPLPTIIIVDSISVSKKPLSVKKIKTNNVETIYFLSSSMKKTIPMAITNKSRNVFIYKKDTMDIHINLEERKQIFIQNLYFQKGKFSINFKNCKFDGDYHVKSFPSDCLIYRKEEEGKE